jgi:type I restriction enzyme, S subunit
MAIENLITEHIDIWTSAIQNKSSSGRGSNKKIDLYGIKKLRELILELAVRGKLVPQDPNDEPASVLLERITAEKTQLVKDKKIKKPKKLPDISDEGSFELPQGWVFERLGKVTKLENGDRSKNYPNKSVLVDSGFPFVNAGHLVDGRINKNEMTFITQERFDLLRAGKFRNDDILYCLRGSLGKSAIVEGFETGAIASSLVIIRVDDNLLPKYLQLYFNSPLSTKSIRLYDNGTAQPNLSATDLAKFILPIPSITEQHRIVAKVDELMALCDQLEQQTEASIEAHQVLVETLLATLTNSADADELMENWQRISTHFDTLFTTEESIDQLKQTILQLAVMGKLVPQDPNDEPASVLLERIEEEKASLIKEKAIRKPKKMKDWVELDRPFALEDSAEWVRLGDLCFTIADGPHFSPQYVEKNEGVPFLSTRNISTSDIDMESAKYVSHEDHEEFCKRVKVKKGDVLYTKGGTTGIAKVNDLDIEFSVWVHLAVLQIPNDKLLNEYLALALNSPHCYLQSQTYTNGIGNKDLGLTRMINITLPLYPLNKQYRIVEKAKALIAICDQLKARLKESQSTQQYLTDAIVEQAV